MTSTPSPAPSQGSQDSQDSAANGEALPAWPDRKDYETRGEPGPHDSEWCRCPRCGSYYRALAVAWEARCRLAIVALRHIQAEPRTSSKDRIVLAQDALYDIGDLPPSPKEQRT